MVKPHLTGAGYGLKDWLIQRITAVLMLVALVVVFTYFYVCPATSGWLGFVRSPAGGSVVIVFAAALCWHAWVGIRNIFMDYIKPPGLRLSLMVAVVTVLVIYFLWAVRLVWRA